MKFTSTLLFLLTGFFLFGQSQFQVDNQTVLINSIPNILDDQSAVPVIIDSGYGDEYSYTINNENLLVDFTNTQSPNNWSALSFFFNTWEGDYSNYFMYDANGNAQAHLTAQGYTLDFTDPANRYITFDIQTDQLINLWFNLYDLTGRTSNIESIQIEIPATTGGVNVTDETKWQTVKIAWTEDESTDAYITQIVDGYSYMWHDVVVGELDVIPANLDLDQISGFGFMIDPFNLGQIGDGKTVVFRNIKIGNQENTAYETLKNIPNVVLSPDNQSQTINIKEYFVGESYNQLLTGITQGNNVNLSVVDTLITIDSKTVCTEFSNIVSVQITTDTKTYTKSFTVSYENPELSYPELGIVTVDSLGQNILIAWERPITQYIDKYEIYREGLTNMYTKIADVPYEQMSVYIDNSALFNTRAYKYGLKQVSVCGETSEMSVPHKSIHLQKNYSDNQLLLNWTQYEGAGILGYRLMEGTSIDNMQKIDEFAYDQTSYTVTNPGEKLYRIETIMNDTIQPSLLKAESGPYAIALSNIAEAKVTKTSKTEPFAIDIYSKQNGIEISSGFTTKITVSNVLGTIVYSSNISDNQSIKIPLKSGVYFVSYVQDNQAKTVKIVVQ